MQQRSAGGSRFCNACGAPVESSNVAPERLREPVSYTPRHLADKILTVRSAVEGERKLVTVLFCDIANSTALDQFFDLILGEVHRYEGTVNQFLGDGVMALFGAPITFEDHAYRGVRAAFGIQQALLRWRTMSDPAAAGLGVRIGLNSGPVVVGKIGDNLRMDYTAIGDTTNLAARLQQLAEPGSIYLSEHTHELVRARVDCRQLGEHAIKGKSERLQVYEAVHEREGTKSETAATSIGTRMIGRQAETAALALAIERVANGQGGICSVIGEAGLGKSRLVTEVRRQMAHLPVRWLEGRGLSFGRTLSYWPFLEILRGASSIAEDDAPTESWRKFTALVTNLFPEGDEEILPYLASLLGLPVPSELELRVKHLDARSMGLQVLLTSRRFFATRYTEVVLRPLSVEDSGELFEGLLDSTDDAPRLRDLVLEKAEGNPFFMEEVLRSLIAIQVLVREELRGAWRLAIPCERIQIPATIQGVIMARVDRLDEGVKQVLRTAAVVGRSFLYRILDAIAETDQQLDRRLAELEGAELVRERRRLPELEYIFKHALVQEATYSSILVERRRHIHLRTAECIETLFAARLEEFYGVLAYHYAAAEVWEKAQEYLFKAGDQAGRVAADAEALAHYRRAIEAYGRAFGDRWEPLQRATLERKIGEALFRRGDHHQAMEYLLRALAHIDTPYPHSRTGLRLSLLREVARQIGHRFLPRLFTLRAVRTSRATAEERGGSIWTWAGSTTSSITKASSMTASRPSIAQKRPDSMLVR
jgi:class 3 adenylate cyclase